MKKTMEPLVAPLREMPPEYALVVPMPTGKSVEVVFVLPMATCRDSKLNLDVYLSQS
jgi:hypothetical protein